jgi:arylsulfatase A-like enzyme
MSQPNLLFVITDQQQAATTDPGTMCQMPNLAGLAAAGTQFTPLLYALIPSAPRPGPA